MFILAFDYCDRPGSDVLGCWSGPSLASLSTWAWCHYDVHLKALCHSLHIHVQYVDLWLYWLVRLYVYMYCATGQRTGSGNGTTFESLPSFMHISGHPNPGFGAVPHPTRRISRTPEASTEPSVDCCNASGRVRLIGYLLEISHCSGCERGRWHVQSQPHSFTGDLEIGSRAVELNQSEASCARDGFWNYDVTRRFVSLGHHKWQSAFKQMWSRFCVSLTYCVWHFLQSVM